VVRNTSNERGRSPCNTWPPWGTSGAGLRLGVVARSVTGIESFRAGRSEQVMKTEP